MKTTPLSLRLTVALHGALHSPNLGVVTGPDGDTNLGVVAGPGGDTNPAPIKTSPYRPRLSTGDIVSKLILSATPQDVVTAFQNRIRKNVPTPPYDKKTLCLVHPQVPAKLEELSSLTGLPKDGVLRLLLEDLVEAHTPGSDLDRCQNRFNAGNLVEAHNP